MFRNDDEVIGEAVFFKPHHKTQWKTSFEKQKGTKYIWGNVYFDIIVFSSLSSTKACLEFL